VALLALADPLLRPPPLGDVGEQDRDPTTPRAAEPERVDVEGPVVERPGLLDEAHRLAGAHDLAVNLEPVRLVPGREVPYARARGVVQAGVRGEGGVDLEESIVFGPTLG